MFGKIWGLIITVSIITGFITGNVSAVSAAITESAVNSVSFCLKLLAITAFWSGIIHIGENAGFISALERILNPILHHMFKTTSPICRKNIVKNISANVFGLGNAATPFGINAIKEMHCNDTASNEAIRFIVLNTASIQLIPTTLISMRAAAASQLTVQIIIPIWISSTIALTFGLIFAKIGELIWK